MIIVVTTYVAATVKTMVMVFVQSNTHEQGAHALTHLAILYNQQYCNGAGHIIARGKTSQPAAATYAIHFVFVIS